MRLQGCPLLLGLAAQHNQITNFPPDLPCLLLRMLNLNGNRYTLATRCKPVSQDWSIVMLTGKVAHIVSMCWCRLHTADGIQLKAWFANAAKRWAAYYFC